MDDAYRELDGHDAYELLGVPDDADERAIRRAFALRVRAVHPDASPEPAAHTEAGRRLHLLKTARDVLLRDREAYDRQRAVRPAAGAAAPKPSGTFRPSKGGGVLLVVLVGYLFALAACVSAVTAYAWKQEPSIPRGLVGTWEGRLEDAGAATGGRVRFTFKAGEGHGTAVYLDAGCTSTLTPRDGDDSYVEFREVVNAPARGCRGDTVGITIGAESLGVMFGPEDPRARATLGRAVP
ncbi:J domain-containing protein [Actinomadura kijaniata]|uniref:J domain-containing protein n=1 Tax=Actinomadura kijaniata TaxID=46161 RepID=UPI00082ED7B8|nr:DnaJ domain-containing protein [Actinomadura kijaniata]